jgi:hypothetical protein
MKKPVYVALFIIWGLFCVVALSMIQGSLSLTPTPNGRWIITHVVNPADSDSSLVLNYLRHREVSPQYDELIVLLEPDQKLSQELKDKGFVIRYKKEADLHLEESSLKTPFFLLTSPRGEGVYAGGYGEPIHDLELAKSYFSNQVMSSFPIAGCGVSVRIQKRLDPQNALMPQAENEHP